MARQCDRPGCSEHGAVAYGFDADRLLVWLSVIDPDADRCRTGVLCKRHADSMVVPLGWSLDDLRDPKPKLFRPPRAARKPRSPRRQSRPTPPPTAADELPLEPPPTAEHVERTVAAITGVGSATDDDPEATVAMPWMPVFDISDDLGGVLQADTPLLARAFQGTERRR